MNRGKAKVSEEEASVARVLRVDRESLDWVNGEVARRNKESKVRHNQNSVVSDLIAEHKAAQK